MVPKTRHEDVEAEAAAGKNRRDDACHKGRTREEDQQQKREIHTQMKERKKATGKKPSYHLDLPVTLDVHIQMYT